MSAESALILGSGTIVWKARYIRSKGQYRIHVYTNSNKIDMIGSAVSTDLPIPFSHRIVKVLLRHTDNASPPADNTDALSVVLRRAAGKVSEIPNFEEDLVNESNIVEAKVRIKGGETHEYEPSIWTLILNTTVNHYVYPVFYVQKTGEAE